MEEGLAVCGYGPLAELFRDPSVREVMVAGPTTVLARRDTAGWVPTTARFANDEHLGESLDRLATHADPVGPVTASVHLFDLKLPNGFRGGGDPAGTRRPFAVRLIRADRGEPSGDRLGAAAHCLGSVAQHHHAQIRE